MVSLTLILNKDPIDFIIGPLLLFNNYKYRYLQVHTVVPSDGGVLQKLGETFDRIGDRQQAFQYYSDV